MKRLRPIEKSIVIYDALKRITRYASTDQMRRNSQRNYGLEYVEMLEMAYENVKNEAASALKGMRRPKITDSIDSRGGQR